MGWSRDSRGSDLEVGSGQTKEAQIVDPNAGQSRGLILGVDGKDSNISIGVIPTGRRAGSQQWRRSLSGGQGVR